ncbi:hypothetical protein BdWA1_001520 [Babesia duncani]|uniref:Uncharacterized protein n=1 Tax=Babesia duncani TaxID=323732 RepID=A0AAD9PK32_9APIC|nr:hypothetical protein BdWA1_001520 [Babesia duncani]
MVNKSIESIHPKELYDKTAWLLNKRLSDHDVKGICDYLAFIGWPNLPSKSLNNPNIHVHFPLWVLNKLIPQFKYVTSETYHAKGNKSDFIGFPSIYRACDVSLLSYLIDHVPSPNYLINHSFLLGKIIALRHSFQDQTLNSATFIKKSKHILNLIHDGSPELIVALKSYDELVVEVTKLLHALVEEKKISSKSSRTNSKFILSLNNTDASKIFFDIMEMLKIWMYVLLDLNCDIPFTEDLVQILLDLFKYFCTICDLLVVPLYNTCASKVAFTFVVNNLESLLHVKVYLEDVWTKLRLFSKKGFSNNSIKCISQYICDVANSIFKVLSIPVSLPFASSICDQGTIQICNELQQGNDVDGYNLDDPHIGYAMKYILIIVRYLTQSKCNHEQLIVIRGLMISLPKIFEEIIRTLESFVPYNNCSHGILFYCNTYFLLIMQKIMDVCTEHFEKDNISISSRNYDYFESILCFYTVLNISKNKRIILCTGEESGPLKNVLSESISFLLQTLHRIYSTSNSNIALSYKLKGFDGEWDIMHARECLYDLTLKNIDGSNTLYLPALVWSCLDILISLNLEYADSNLQEILYFLQEDYILCHNEGLDIQTFEATINKFESTTMISLPSQAFVGNLISMYCEANDLISLVDKIGEFITSSNYKEVLFFNHPHACAFRKNYSQSNTLQAPRILQSIYNFISDEKCSEFMFAIFSLYISDISFTNPVIKKVLPPLEKILDSLKLGHNQQSITLGLHVLVVIRKVLLFEHRGLSLDVLFGVLDSLYKYLTSLQEYISQNCNATMITAISWYCYHFAMLLLQKGFEDRNWHGGIEKMIQYVIMQVTNCNDFGLVKIAGSIIIGNPKAFDQFVCYNKCGGMIIKSLTGMEFTFPLLEVLQDLVISIHLDETLSIILMHKLLENLKNDTVGNKCKVSVIRIIRILVDSSLTLYIGSESYIVNVFNNLMRLSCNLIDTSPSCDDDIMQIIIDILDCILRVIKNERAINSFYCTHLILEDYCTFIRLQTNGLNYSCERQGVNFIKFLHVIKSKSLSIVQNIGALQPFSKLFGNILGNLYYIIMSSDLEKKVKLPNVESCYLKCNKTFERVLKTICEFEEFSNLTNVVNGKFETNAITVLVILSFLQYIKHVGELNSLEDFLVHDQKEYNEFMNSAISHIHNCDTSVIDAHLAHYFAIVHIMTYWIDTWNVNVVDFCNAINNTCKIVLELDLIYAPQNAYQAVLNILLGIVNNTDADELKSNTKWATIMDVLFNTIGIKAKNIKGLDFSKESFDILEFSLDHFDSKSIDASMVVRELFKKCPNVEQYQLYQSHLNTIYKRLSLFKSKGKGWEIISCIELLSLLIKQMESPGSGFRKQPLEFLNKGILLDIKVILSLHARDIDGYVKLSDQNRDFQMLLFNYLSNAASSIKLFNLIRRFDAVKSDQGIPLSFGEHLLLLANVGIHLLTEWFVSMLLNNIYPVAKL